MRHLKSPVGVTGPQARSRYGSVAEAEAALGPVFFAQVADLVNRAMPRLGPVTAGEVAAAVRKEERDYREGVLDALAWWAAGVP